MLDAITLENFKAFKKLDNLPVKPITILCGTNSSGKSSILQSILMLKQTLESINPNQTLLLNGKFAKLGAFEDVIYQKKEENIVSVSFKFNIDFSSLKREPNNPMEKYKTLNSIGNKVLKKLFQIFDNGVGTNLTYKTLIKIDLQSIEKNNLIKLIDVVNLKIIVKEPISHQPRIINCKKNKDSSFNITWKNINYEHRSVNYPPNGSIDVNLHFKGLFIEFITSQDKLLRFDEYVLAQDITNLFNTYNELIETILKTFHYLGPLRGEPEREYIYRDEVLEIGNKGENAAFLFLTEQHKKIENHYFYQKRNDDFNKIQKLTLEEALAKWFNIIGVKDFAGEVINKIIYLNLNASKHDKTKVGIADVGFGISQIFPIFLEGLRMETGSTLMLEQPEIHLHPNLQMQLSDFFIALAKSGKRFLVETHSDHIVNRLVRRIVEDETGSLKDLIGIYFIKPTDEGSVYEEIQIDDKKGIVNWPKDFFDQAANEQLKIMQAGLKKRQMNGKVI